jgi:hypothetical protein
MLTFTVDGKKVDARDLENALEKVMLDRVSAQLRERFGAIRHPETGEFATVVIQGDSLQSLKVRVEGSEALLALVRTRFAPEEAASMEWIAKPEGPKAFLSYAFRDRDLAKRIAEGLQANGIETWWAEWEIGAGDSIRQKVDEGLSDCTHFIVLLTPDALASPWVQTEIDAGFVRKVNAASKLIPLRHGVAVSKLPPTLSGALSPEVDDTALDLTQLINDIHGLTRKPLLGPVPKAEPSTGYSAAATAIARVFVERTRFATFGDPQFTVEALAEAAGQTREDVIDGLHELQAFFKLGFGRALPKDSLFGEFDRYWQSWDPAEDALRLAADIASDPGFPAAPSEIAERYTWEARRLNPAIAYLDDRGAVRTLKGIGTGPFIAYQVVGTDATRRFVKSRS